MYTCVAPFVKSKMFPGSSRTCGGSWRRTSSWQQIRVWYYNLTFAIFSRTLMQGFNAKFCSELTIRFSGNLYKWAYAPRSSGILWIAPRHKGKVIPLVTSAYSGYTMHHRFSYLGTRDTSNHFAIPDALDFYQSIGLVSSEGHSRLLISVRLSPFQAKQSSASPNLFQRFSTGESRAGRGWLVKNQRN